MRNNWCQEITSRKHFAKKGRLYCERHFTERFNKASKKFEFLFQDVYTRYLATGIKNLLRQTPGRTGMKSEYASDVYTIPVEFKKDDE